MLSHKLNKNYWMHEIKLLLSAKLCAVTVFASCRSKNVRQRFPTAAIAATYMRPRWGRWREITAMCLEIADSSLRNAPRSVSRVRSGFRDDDMAGVCGENLPQCCLPPRPKALKNLKGVKLGQKRAVFYDNTNNM